ncbi:hypothetical protein WJX72_012169 [[Myrmecia] bisecta]|uniref:YDG domain-containing protein n=1 Tax=[Myrmecia] bisecta TaxID=41462 RepID=A0AAW1Q8U4_9CHLO
MNATKRTRGIRPKPVEAKKDVAAVVKKASKGRKVAVKEPTETKANGPTANPELPDIDGRLQWARDQMEQAYARELGVAPAVPGAKQAKPKARAAGQAGSNAKGRGEQAAAELNCNMTAVMSEYELERQKRIEANKKMLASLGLGRGDGAEGEDRFALLREPAAPVPVKRKRAEPTGPQAPSRRSARASKEVRRFGEYAEETWYLGGGDGGARASKSPASQFGAPEGVEVGQLWISRVACAQAAVHGPWVGGIHGGESTGAYSVVLSGGYEGDVDDGEEFTYTGSGGRDLSGNKRVAEQSSDQQLSGNNLALAVNIWRKNPMRVVRGSKNKSQYAPAEGYRYDGLYEVAEMWPEKGESGYVMWRFRMKRLTDQALPPWKARNWRETEAAEIAAAKEAHGDKPLIPLGTGTLQGLTAAAAKKEKHT